MDFNDAIARLASLLATLEWPSQIVWVRPEQVLYFPLRSTIVFRPQPDAAAGAYARSVFDRRYGSAPAISFYAAGHAEGRTFAYVLAIEELGQGEQMFVTDGLKVSAQAAVAPTHVTTSRFWWWLYKRRYRRWSTRQERALAGA